MTLAAAAPSRRLGLSLMAMTIAGWCLGFPLGFFAAHLLGLVGLGAIVGAVVGLMQWIAVRRLVPRPRWWILASAGGIGLACGLGGMASALLRIGFEQGRGEGMVAWVTVLAAGGGLAGVAQARALGCFHIGRAAWIAASAAGWGLSILGAVALLPGARSGSPALLVIRNLVAPAALMGAIHGGITGAVIAAWPRRG